MKKLKVKGVSGMEYIVTTRAFNLNEGWLVCDNGVYLNTDNIESVRVVEEDA